MALPTGLSPPRAFLLARHLSDLLPELSGVNAMPGRSWRTGRNTSDFFDELRLQFHGADAVDLAVDVVVAVHQADVLHLGAHLHHQGRALDLEILDHRDAVAVLEHIAVGVLVDLVALTGLGRAVRGPLVGALRADQQGAVGVAECGATPGAGGKGVHVYLLAGARLAARQGGGIMPAAPWGCPLTWRRGCAGRGLCRRPTPATRRLAGWRSPRSP